MPITDVVNTAATPAPSTSRTSANRRVREELPEVGERQLPHLVGEGIVEDADQRKDDEDDQEHPDQAEPEGGRRCAGQRHRSSRIAMVLLAAKVTATALPICSTSWCQRIAYVGLEDDAGTQLDIVAQRISEVGRKGDAALDEVAPPSRLAANRRVLRPDAQDAAVARLQPLVKQGGQLSQGRVDPQAALAAVRGHDRAVDQVVDADEIGNEAVGGPLVKLLRWPHLEHPALIEDSDPVRQGERLFLVVGHVHGGDAEAPSGACEFPASPAPGSWHRGWTAARRAAGFAGSRPEPAPAPRAAAVRPRAGPDSGRRGP